ncbi:hypothetical protein JCM1840_005335 [Sporobolomyces johnsonii]
MSFSFPAKSPANAPGGRAGGRPGPQRLSSGGARANPYERPSTPSVDGKWQHDLFSADSDLYRPKINVKELMRKLPGAAQVPSPSLRPFGAATPAPQLLLSASAPAAPVPTPAPTAPVAQQPDMFARLGIKGSSDAAAEKERQRQAKLQRAKAERERKEQLRLRKELEAEREIKVKIAQEEDLGFVVQVEGLVYGTSAEDVQTAFGSYGEIRFCFIVNEKTATEQDELVARLTFTRYDDAATACSKLDGAVADGRPLKVQQVSRSPMPPALPPLAAITAATAAPAIPTGPRAVPAAPAPAPSKMYADEIEDIASSLVPTASTSDSMDVDMADTPSIPTGPRNGFAAGRGVRGGRGGRGGGAAPQGGAAAGGLLNRLAPTAPAAMRGGGASAAQQQQQKAGLSLAERLGGTSNGKRQGGKGAAGGEPSLLTRLG